MVGRVKLEEAFMQDNFVSFLSPFRIVFPYHKSYFARTIVKVLIYKRS